MDFGIAGVAAITVIAYAVGQAMRALGRLDRWIPTVCAALGGALGVAGLYIMPGFPAGGRHHRRRHRRGVGPGGHRRPAGGEAALHRAGLRQGKVIFDSLRGLPPETVKKGGGPLFPGREKT